MYNSGNKRIYKKSSFRVKRPIRSFRDLEVYQRTSDTAVRIIRDILPLLKDKQCPFIEKLVDSCLNIPRFIGKSHSKRFDHPQEALSILEEAKDICNDVAVYLEQIRDIYVEDVDRVVCDEIVKEYFYSRRKIFNLYKAWKRIDIEN